MRGDVVVVTVNHRLDVFGHLYLARLAGERVRGIGERRHTRSRAGADLGARSRRRVRRRSARVTRVRSVGRRREDRDADGDARSARAVPSRHDDERPADHGFRPPQRDPAGAGLSRGARDRSARYRRLARRWIRKRSSRRLAPPDPTLDRVAPFTSVRYSITTRCRVIRSIRTRRRSRGTFP